MSWITLLKETYDNSIARGAARELKPLLPIAHTTQNADITVSIDSDGDFIGSYVIENKEDRQTIIPCTEKSANRTSGVVPHPLFDKLQYLAGDYLKYGGREKAFDYEEYLEQLNNWCESEYSTPEIRAVYTYLSKGTLIEDLVSDGTLYCDENNKLISKWNGDKKDAPQIFKMIPGGQLEVFVRFSVSTFGMTRDLWQDKELQQKFIGYITSKMKDRRFCYATGEVIPCSSSHPAKIRNTGDKAKLISTNDEHGFSYRGRFETAEQVMQVGYEVSQKAHNALKWLIEKQGVKLKDKVYLLWGTEGEDMPGLAGNTDECISSKTESDTEKEDNKTALTEMEFAERFNKAILGYKCDLQNTSKVALIGLDSATTGRMSITYYREFIGEQAFELIDRIKNWHETCYWIHSYKPKDGDWKTFWGAPSPKDIALAAFGTEQNGILKADDKLVGSTVERILKCIVDSSPIPSDIVRACLSKAIRPQSYEAYNWDKVRRTTCAVYRKYLNDKAKREVWKMNVDLNSDDIVYNCGRLLAVINVIERMALLSNEDKRATNAMRYFTKYALNPCGTLSILQNKIQPYINRFGGSGIFLLKRNLIEEKEVIAKLIPAKEFKELRNLDGRFVLGYDSEMNYLYSNDKSNKEEENNNGSITEQN